MIRVTMFISIGKKTFSETHICMAASNVGQAQPLAADLATARARLLGFGCTIDAVRVSDTAHLRQVQFVDPSSYAGESPYSAAAVANDTDQANDAMMLRFTTAGLPKTLYLAGVPALILGTFFDPNTDLQPELNPAWVKAFLAYTGGASFGAGLLTGGSWGCAQKAPSNVQNAVAVVPGAPYAGFAGVATGAPLAAVAGGKILVKGFRSINPRLKAISGVYTVLAVQAGNIYVLAATTAGQVANVKPLPGTAADLAFTANRYTTCVPMRGTTRKRGGRVFLPLGRSLTRH